MLIAHNSKTTGPMANILTVLESALRGEGPICFETFFGFFLDFFLVSGLVFNPYEADKLFVHLNFVGWWVGWWVGWGGLTRAKPGGCTSL
jgi:hypothetical protein